MKIIFLGGFFPKQYYDAIVSKSKRQLQSAANNFQWAFIDGLDQNCQDNPISIITAPFIGWFPRYYNDLYLTSAEFEHVGQNLGHMVGFLNIPLIKNFFKFINLRKKIKDVVGVDDTTIIVYSLDIAYLRAAISSKKNNPKLKVCVIIPDLHEFPGDAFFLYQWYIKYYEKPMFYKLLSQIDSFVVLTDQMVNYLNIGDRPWTRVEGLYNETKVPVSYPSDSNAKIILYTGTLDYKYGIRDLLDSFNLIENSNYQLWICGGGVGKQLVLDRKAADKRIHYFGIVSRPEVEELQAKATLLINPRNNDGEYNKYSFPSKTMEYFASGTATLLYRLEGIPQEYFEYCYTIEDDAKKSSSENIASAIKKTCELDPSVLEETGERARNFVLKYKNSAMQCKKVLTMINR